MMDIMADTRHVNAKITWLCTRDSIGPSELSRIAGVTRHAARQYFADAKPPSLPSGPALRSIAEHFDVSLHWLLDDEADEEHPLSDAEVLSDEYLMHEAARRYAAAENRLLSIIEAAESIDWEGVAKELEAGTSLSDIDPQTENKLGVARALNYIINSTIDLYDSVRVARHGSGWLQARYGDADNDRRQYLQKRIEAIHERLMPTPRAASAFMSFQRGHVFVVNDAEAAFGLAEECLAAAGIKIETPEARRVRLMNERNSDIQAHLDAGGPRARKRKS